MCVIMYAVYSYYAFCTTFLKQWNYLVNHLLSNTSGLQENETISVNYCEVDTLSTITLCSMIINSVWILSLLDALYQDFKLFLHTGTQQYNVVLTEVYSELPHGFMIYLNPWQSLSVLLICVFPQLCIWVNLSSSYHMF